MPPVIEASHAALRRRKMRGALAALARHGDQVDGTAKKDSFSADANSCADLGIRPSSSTPNGIAVSQSAHTSSSSGTLNYAPPSSYYADGTGAEITHGSSSTCDDARSHRSEEIMCSISSLPPPPSYDEAMSTCLASRVTLASTTRKNPSNISYKKRMSSLKTASTSTMCSFNDDDDVGATAPEAFSHDWNKEAIPSDSSPPPSSLGDREPIYFTGCLNDCRPNLPSSPSSSSSSRDASPIARRRPHHDSLVSTAHSLASADSVRAELERIQNLGRDVPPMASPSSRRTTKPKVRADQDVSFRGYSNRRQSSASVSGLSAGPTGYGGGGSGSVSSLSHFTSVSRGSFSSIPRMILKDDNAKDDVSYDPLSYNFVDSDSDSDVDAEHLEDKLHTIRVEQLKIAFLEASLGNLEEKKSESPTNEKNPTRISEAKKASSNNTTTSFEESHPKDNNETSPTLSHLDVETQYLLAMGPRQEPAKLSPHPSISSSASSADNDTEPQTHPQYEHQDQPNKGKEPGASNDDTAGMARLPMRRRGSWTTALGA